MGEGKRSSFFCLFCSILTKILVVSLFEQNLVIVSIGDKGVGKATAVGGGTPDDHDHQQDERKQHMPEAIPQPHLPPVLNKNRFLRSYLPLFPRGSEGSYPLKHSEYLKVDTLFHLMPTPTT